MSEKQKILITHSEVPIKGLDILKDRYELIFSPSIPFPTREQILKDIKGVSGVIWWGKHVVNEEVVEAAGPNLKIVAAMSAGYDNINVDLLKSRGIKVSNTPDVLSNSVAELAVGLLLSAARRLVEGYHAILDDKWDSSRPQWLLGQDVCNSTVGIIGLGSIGAVICKKLKGFDVGTFLYTGRSEKPIGKTLGAKFVTLDKLLEQSDFVIITCALTPETTHLINRDTLKKMKKTSILVNVSRGGIIDQEALIEALQNKTIWAAALDVMTPEPLPSDHPLTKLPNCVLSPHIGSATLKTREEMARLAAQNVFNALNDFPLATPL